MNKSKIVFIILLIILMHGCLDLGIYISDFPLGPPGSSITASGIKGKWEKVSKTKNEEGINSMEFILFNESEYILRSGDNNEKSLIRAFSTEIGGFQFLNIQDLSETEKKFVFCKYSISEKQILTLQFIGDTIFKSDPPSTSKRLRKLIKKNLNNPTLFNEEMKFTFRKIED